MMRLGVVLLALTVVGCTAAGEVEKTARSAGVTVDWVNEKLAAIDQKVAASKEPKPDSFLTNPEFYGSIGLLIAGTFGIYKGWQKTYNGPASVAPNRNTNAS